MRVSNRVSNNKDVTKYIGGLHTESHALDFPDNFSFDEDNFELLRDRSRRRRKGLDYEANYALVNNVATSLPFTIDHTTAAFGSFVWDSPGGFLQQSGLLVQSGNYVFYHNLRSLTGEVGAPPTGLRIAAPNQNNPVITAIANTNPISITTAAAHGLVTGSSIKIIDNSLSVQVLEETLHTVTVTSATTFKLNGVDATAYPVYSTASGSALFDAYDKDYIDLSWFRASTNTTAATIAKDHIDITFGLSRAFVVGKNINPFYIEYHVDELRASVHQIDIEVRDVDGVADGIPVDLRPGVPTSSKHLYNLYNQGWIDQHLDTFKTATPAATGVIQNITPGPKVPGPIVVDLGTDAVAAGFVVGDSLTIRDSIAGGLPQATPVGSYPVINNTHLVTDVAADGANTVRIDLPIRIAAGYWFFSYFGSWGRVPAGGGQTYPSNADIWTFGKNATFNGTSAAADHDFDPFILAKQDFGSTKAPRGHFIYSAFGLFRGAHSVGVPDVIEVNRPTTTIFYSGRLFYSGVQGNNISGKIYFSRVVRDVATHAGQCYQDNDPTSEHFNELLPNDGGVIEIPQSGIIKKITSLGNNLIVFASNGIWVIQSPAGFSSDNYSVAQVSNIGTIYPDSVVTTDYGVIYAARSGIYVIDAELKVQDITQKTIATKYQETLLGAFPDVKTVYDEVSKKVYFWYNSDTTETITERFNKVLIYDFILGNWSTYSIASGAGMPFVCSAFFSPAHPVNQFPKMKMMTVVPVGVTTPFSSWSYTFSDFVDTTFKDWKLIDSIGTDAAAYMETGYDLFGTLSLDKQTDHVTVFSKSTEVYNADGSIASGESSCLLQAKWNFANDDASGKWSTQQEVYKIRKYLDVSQTRSKFSGSGKALQLRFETSPSKDCHILAWSLDVSGNTKV